MPDKPIRPGPTSDQGEARFCADLTAYLDSPLLQKLGDLLSELPDKR